MTDPRVVAVCAAAEHTMSKPALASISLLAGLGVAGDAHLGELVQHRSRVRRDPNQPNLRQVHLIHDELLDELRDAGFPVGPGLLGENITTRDIDLLGLATGSRLHFDGGAVVEITGLRNPCVQLDGLFTGLMQAVLDRAPDGRLIRKAGVMGVVRAGGSVRAGTSITVQAPTGPATALQPV
ncbi:MAG TPA: MOSC domain-containing protein [Jatrophihabitans sp.]|nr:MOSC domain-containing protein [Jatrophihabitans sp.]